MSIPSSAYRGLRIWVLVSTHFLPCSFPAHTLSSKLCEFFINPNNVMPYLIPPPYICSAFPLKFLSLQLSIHQSNHPSIHPMFINSFLSALNCAKHRTTTRKNQALPLLVRVGHISSEPTVLNSTGENYKALWTCPM